MCTNTDGSFTCGCNIGYLLDTDGTTCKGIYTGSKPVYSTMYTIMELQRPQIKNYTIHTYIYYNYICYTCNIFKYN